MARGNADSAADAEKMIRLKLIQPWHLVGTSTPDVLAWLFKLKINLLQLDGKEAKRFQDPMHDQAFDRADPFGQCVGR